MIDKEAVSGITGPTAVNCGATQIVGEMVFHQLTNGIHKLFNDLV